MEFISKMMRLSLIITKNKKMSKMIYINKKARYEYFLIDELIAGIELTSNEVKSIISGTFVAGDAYIYFDGDIPLINNLFISKYSRQHPSCVHDENRVKRLLLTSSQIKSLKKELKTRGNTIILLNIQIINNKIKMGIALSKGKKDIDKRNTIKERDVLRDMMRNI